MTFTLTFPFSGKVWWYLSAKQRLWRGKANRDSWKYFMRLTEELVVSKHLWFMWAVLGPYRPTQLQAYEVFFLQPDSESMCPA